MALRSSWTNLLGFAAVGIGLSVACAQVARMWSPGRPDGRLRELPVAARTPPANPTVKMELVSEFQLPGSVLNMAVMGNALYAAMGFDGWEILDAADPIHPRAVERFEGMVKPHDPKARVIVGFYPDEERHRLFVLDRIQGLSIYDATDPLKPVFRGIKHLPGNYSERAISIARAGDNFYLSCGGAGLRSLPVEFNEETECPACLGHFDHTRQSIFHAPHWLLVADGCDTGLQVLDLASPSFPRLAHQFHIGTYCDQAVPLGNYAVLSNRSLGFTVMDMRDPEQPFIASRYIPASPVEFKSMVLWRSRFLVVGALKGHTDGFLNVFDLKDPLHPVFEDILGASCEVNTLTLSEDLVYAGFWNKNKVGIYRLTEM